MCFVNKFLLLVDKFFQRMTPDLLFVAERMTKAERLHQGVEVLADPGDICLYYFYLSSKNFHFVCFATLSEKFSETSEKCATRSFTIWQTS